MKIVDRKTFLAMPEGTLFSKYRPNFFEDISIKLETVDNDYYNTSICDAVESNSSDEMDDILDSALKTGQSFNIDLDSSMRDGLFEDDVFFAVWEKKDVEHLIKKLIEMVKYQGCSLHNEAIKLLDKLPMVQERMFPHEIEEHDEIINQVRRLYDLRKASSVFD